MYKRQLHGRGRAVAALAAGAAALFAGKVDVVRNDLKRIALVAGFVLIRARLDGTVHGDEVAFVEILANKFRSLAPDHDVDKVCFALFKMCIRDRTQDVIHIIDNILARNGIDKTRVLTAAITLADMADYGAFNACLLYTSANIIIIV